MYKNKLLSICKNRHYYERYVKFIEYRINNPIDTRRYYTEKHHILPSSLFPEYKKEKWNIVVLSGREHFLVHYLLAKLTNHNSMWFAFNQMKRVASNRFNSVLYEMHRKTISNLISKTNTGRVRSKEQRKILSETHSGFIVCRNKKGEIERVSVNDERYLKGELTHHRTGSKHKKETIEKMKRNNYYTGKVLCHNIKTGKQDCFLENEIPDGWKRGPSKKAKEKNSESVSKLKWYTNLETNECIRVSSTKELPKNGKWVRKRFFENNKGFEVANKMINVVNLKERVCEKINPEFLKEYHAPESGLSTKNTFVIVYNNKIYTSFTSFEKDNNTGLNRKELLENGKIKKPHFNNTPEIKKFRSMFKGKRVFEIGILVYNLIEFDYEEHKRKVIYGRKRFGRNV